MPGPDLHVVSAGDGPAVVLLHGLTATHRYVVHGSRALERGGFRVVAYDARGHGASDPAPSPDAYTYPLLAEDLGRVMDESGLDRAVLAGASMGAHTALRFALDHPDRVAGLVLITPAHDGAAPEASRTKDLARWDRLSEGLRSGGVEGFVAAYGDPGVKPEWRETVLKVLEQRLSRHEHPDALADALRAVPRSAPFDTLADLGWIGAPTVVVGDQDSADPGHPLAVAIAYADTIPGAELVVEEEGESPIAWSGGRLSKVIADLARTVR